MAKGGRPTKYKKILAKRLPEMFKDGQSVCEVCVDLGIHKDTFYEWVKLYPEFSDAYKKGLSLSQGWWEKLGRGGAAGKIEIQPATWIFNMKNRFHDDWKDKHEITTAELPPVRVGLDLPPGFNPDEQSVQSEGDDTDD